MSGTPQAGAAHPALEEPARVARLARALEAAWGPPPSLAVVLGSGLGALETLVAPEGGIPYAALPGLPAPTVAGHSGRLLWGACEGIRVVLLCGRLHLYEGRGPDEVVRLVRAAARAGVGRFLLTNAAGGIRADLGPGSLMVLRDQINQQGVTPFLGPHRPEFGPRFPDASRLYDPEVRRILAAAGLPVEGVYLANLGPAFESPAEVARAALLGADAVGMSMAQEALALSALGARVGGISLIANRAAGLGLDRLSHAEVIAVAAATAPRLAAAIRAAAPSLAGLAAAG